MQPWVQVVKVEQVMGVLVLMLVLVMEVLVVKCRLH